MTNGAEIRTRFAPTPSGLLHIGNACSFALTWLVARSSNGKVRLRIDDLDAARKRPEYVTDIFESLEWLELDYDEGPTGPDDFERNFSQHNRLDVYAQALSQLRSQGNLFACDCSRATIRQNSSGLHPSACLSKRTDFDAPGVAWRAMTESANAIEWIDSNSTPRNVNLHATMRDFVVRRKDAIPSYQVASLVDDCEYGINLIVRGEDLIESTACQRWLAAKLNLDDFVQAEFLHHALVKTPDNQKLSKSAGANSLRATREKHKSPQTVFDAISKWLKLPNSADSAKSLLAIWSSL